MKYIFGPVISRRLGVSLGIDIVPYKTCSFDCIYCECGRTTSKTIERKPYIHADAIINELQEYLKTSPKLDYITITGSGEPALNSEIGLIIRKIKSITKVPLAVLTNAGLFCFPEVRKDLLRADLVVPSLDAVSPALFLKIDRPHENLDLNKIIRGLTLFRKEFKGRIWLEILFIKNMNHRPAEIDKMIKIIQKIKPDKIQLNTIDRPPAELYARPISISEMNNVYNKFMEKGLPAEIIMAQEKKVNTQSSYNIDIYERIINVIKRRPETSRHIADILGIRINSINKILRDMEKQKIITSASSGDLKGVYYKFSGHKKGNS